MEIGKQIAVYRKQQNMTQEKLGEILNVSNRTVSKWESDVALPGVDQIPKIAAALQISLDQLFGIEPKPAPADLTKIIDEVVQKAVRKALPNALEDALEDLQDTINASSIKPVILILSKDKKLVIESVGQVMVSGPGKVNGKPGYAVQTQTIYNSWFLAGSYDTEEEAQEAVQKIYTAISNGCNKIEM